MLDLAGVVTLVRWAFFGALALCLILPLLLNKTAKARVSWSLAMLAVFASIVGLAYYTQVWQPRQLAMEEARSQGLPATADERKARYEAAKALFDERCKTAGAKIYKTVDGVEGVLLLNVRSNNRLTDSADPNWPDAGLSDEPSGEDYIVNFLHWEHHEDKRNTRGYLNDVPSDLPGYRFADVKDKEGVMWRYTLRKEGEVGYPHPTKAELKSQPARYAVSFTNMPDSEDRKKWVAGTKVTVTDTRTSEVLAESTWYSFEPGQGSTAGSRSPWNLARTCPSLMSPARAPTRFFVDQVLKPRGK